MLTHGLKMATRNVAEFPNRLSKCTEFQLFGQGGGNVIDITLHRLVKYAASTTDVQQKMVLCAMIDDYKMGNIAIAWKRGQPVYVHVTRTV